MSYRKKIKVFVLKNNINLPIKSNPDKTANCNIGDLLVCWDGKNVYAKDWNDNEEEDFVLLLNDLTFIEINKHFFENITGNIKDNMNDVIEVAEKLYYEANPDTKMDVPSFVYEAVETENKKRKEANSSMSLYHWCKSRIKV